MPHDSQPYAASVNPARRAKQSSLRAILPQPTSTSTDGSDFESQSAPTPAKRGRKPGPLSRAARETQRKLNHSIIEKARRTKINDALTSLKHLVPAGYGNPPPQPGDEDEEANKKKGKKEEKDKEFKLEILERTVIFLQDVLKRVEVLEGNASSSSNTVLCAKCSSLISPNSPLYPDRTHLEDPEPFLKRKRSLSSHTSWSNLDTVAEPSSKRPRPCSSPLPPISSWLPNLDRIPISVSQIDPQLLNSSPLQAAQLPFSSSAATGLPSPPLSTHFAPQQHPLSSSVPTLHLGASAGTLQSPSHSPSSSASKASRSPPTSSESYRTPPPLLSPRRTPEDESAASLLLQISASASATLVPVDHDASRTWFSARAPGNGNGNGDGNVQAQTPGSMLGLVEVRTARRG